MVLPGGYSCKSKDVPILKTYHTIKVSHGQLFLEIDALMHLQIQGTRASLPKAVGLMSLQSLCRSKGVSPEAAFWVPSRLQ